MTAFTFHRTERVLCCGTPLATDASGREGGPGKIIDIHGRDEFDNEWYLIALDSSPAEQRLYTHHELQPAPTV